MADHDPDLQLTRRLIAFLRRPDLKPGAYNEPAFIEMEKENPEVLGTYAHFVTKERRRSKKEDQRIRSTVRGIVDRFVEQVEPEQIRSQCATATYALLQLEEWAGFFAYGVHGALKVEFERGSGFDPITFWSHTTNKKGIAGHYWLAVPPYRVVDVTARLQAWENGEGSIIDSKIVLLNATGVPPDIKMHAPSDELHLFPWGAPMHQHLWSWLPPLRAEVGRTRLTYQPYAIRAPPANEPVEGSSFRVRGRTLRQFYEEEIAVNT